MEEICKKCEFNNGKECTNTLTGNFEPYGNCCQRVLGIVEELNRLKKCQYITDKSWNELLDELKIAKDNAFRWETLWNRASESVSKLQKQLSNKEKELVKCKARIAIIDKDQK